MSDFLSRITAEDPPEAHQIKVGKEKGTVWFRRISAGERRQLLAGQKLEHKPGSPMVVEVDLELNEKENQMLVLFSVCNEDGTRYFPDIAAVEKVPAHKLRPLINAAMKVNRGLEDEPGKD